MTRTLFGAARAAVTVQRELTRPIRLTLEGLTAPVEVLTDAWGVGHIYADNSYDLFFAQGFVTARDRMFQLDFTRHAARGRLAELVGQKPVPWRDMTVQLRGFDTLDADVLLRSIGVAQSAEASLPLHSSDVRAILDAYTAGVNAFIATGERSLEHKLLNAVIAPWTSVDSILTFKAIGLELSPAWRAALFGAMLLATDLPEDVARCIWPHYPLSGSSIVRDETVLTVAREVLSASTVTRELTGIGNAPGLGSNCFAIAGTHTATGEALLANDTHLIMQAPSRWHEIGLHGGGYDLQGFALAGLPGVGIGRTRHHVWGITAALVQDLDVFVEKIHPTSPHRYLTPDGWQDLEEWNETFHIKGKPSITRTLQRTRHGPLIDVATRPKASQHMRYALAWAGMDPARDFEGLVRSWMVTSYDGFRAALVDVTSCPFNISYADRDGHIGYIMTGKLPKRRVGAPTRPLEGWTGEWDWQGIVPFAQHPYAYDPPCGFIVTANQRVASASYPYELGGVFEPSERADRITQRLAALGRAVTFDDLLALQLDTYSLMGRATRDAYIDIAGGVEMLAAQVSQRTGQTSGKAAKREPTAQAEPPRQTGQTSGKAAKREPTAQAERAPNGREAALAWAQWDCEARRDSVGATIAYLTVFEIARAVVSALAGDDAVLGLMDQPSFTHLPLMRFPKMRARLAQLGVDLATVTREAFASTVARCTAELGPDIAQWQWGRLHQLTLKHPFHHTPGLRELFSIGPEPSEGCSDTVNRGDITSTFSFEHRAGAAMRMVASACDVGRAATILPGGQSGDRLSKHYDDQFADFLSGRFKPAPFDEPHGVPSRRESLWPAAARTNNVA
jgi:penicillin amidase